MQNLLKKQGASGDEVKNIMSQLRDKVQNVEKLMRDDENRQNELLQRRLDARRARRKALQEELKEVDQKIRNNEAVKEQEQE
jgi:hypothetical protein